MGRYLPEVFGVQTKRPRSEICAEKPEGKYFSYRTTKPG